MDHQAALVDLQAWQAHSLVVAALRTVAINQASMARATTRATEEATLMVPATSITVATTSSNMALPKVTVAAVPVASSVTSRAVVLVVTSRTAAPVAMATRQAAVPAVLTLVLHLRVPTSHLVLHHRAMALIPDHRRRTMARSMVLRRRASALNQGPTTHQVATTDSSHMAASSRVVSGVSTKQAPTVLRRPSTAAMAKAATAVRVDTNNLMVDIHKADTAARHLQEGMAAVDTSNRMATAVMEGDLVGQGLDVGRRA